MKKRYQLQYHRKPYGGKGWAKSGWDKECVLLREKKESVDYWMNINEAYRFRVVQKLGRKVIKVIYPKGK